MNQPVGCTIVFGDARLTGSFWSKVAVDSTTGCWNWTASRYKNGYGAYGVPSGQRPKNQPVVRLAHRFAYERLVGDPGKLSLDHLCHNGNDCLLANDCPHRACVNPAHLEPVTARENLMRGNTTTRLNAEKTHCKWGHEYTKENTYIINGGKSRGCRACALPRMRSYGARMRALARDKQSN